MAHRDNSDRRAAFDAFSATLGLSSDMPFALDETIRPDSPLLARPTDARGAAPVAGLPTITLSFVDPDAVASPAARETDLVVHAQLGAGGMGTVHLAHQRSLRRDVAVKRIHEGANEAGLCSALLHEAVAMGSLEHPNIVPVHALGLEKPGRPLLVMKRISGVLWRDLIRDPSHPALARLRQGSDDPLLAHITVLSQVCNALQFAHSRGIIHRDVKPDNVMIGEYGEVYLLDWGIALDRNSTPDDAVQPLVGTPAYMAPEMLGGTAGTIDARTDVYLLGATLHEVLTGRPRHAGSTIHAVLLSAALSEPVTFDASIPKELAALCNLATSCERPERPESAEAFRLALADYQRHRGSLDLSDSADARIAELNAGAANGSDDLLGANAYRALTESRFAYARALKDWPGNAAASAGLDACLALMLERELRLKNTAAARALVDEIHGDVKDFTSRIEAQEKAALLEHEQAESMKRETHEMDTSISLRARRIILVFLLVMSSALGVQSVRLMSGSAPRPPISAVALLGSVIALAVVGLVIGGRKRLLANRVGRQLTLAAVLAVSSTAVADLVLWYEGGTFHQASVIMLLLYAAQFALASIMGMDGMLSGALAMVAALGVAVVFPRADALATSIALAVTMIAIMRAAQKPQSPVATPRASNGSPGSTR